MEIQQTTDYSIFNRLNSNREIDERKVKRLIGKIKRKNLLYLYPGLCNSSMDIIDGQHRLEAAKILELPYFFRVDDNVDESDIADINSAGSNWTVNDYINYWTVKRKPGFDVLSTFMIENSLLPASTVLKMIGSIGGGNTTAKLREGYIDVSNIDSANEICAVLEEYAELINFAYDRNFVLAIICCLRTPEYDHQIMKRKLEYQSRVLRKCITVRHYVEMLEEIYNYGSSKKKVRIII